MNDGSPSSVSHHKWQPLFCSDSTLLHGSRSGLTVKPEMNVNIDYINVACTILCGMQVEVSARIFFFIPWTLSRTFIHEKGPFHANYSTLKKMILATWIIFMTILNYFHDNIWCTKLLSLIQYLFEYISHSVFPIIRLSKSNITSQANKQ